MFIECSGFDFKILKKCLNIIVTGLADMGGKIYQMELNYSRAQGGKQKTPDLTPEKTKISIENVKKLLGLNINEKQNYISYYYSSNFLFARGYEAVFFENLYKVSANYSLPLLYIDHASWPVESFLYFKRLDLNLFFDLAYGNENEKSQFFKSAGFELMFNHNVFSNKILVINTGIRFSYGLDNKEKTIGILVTL